MTPCEQVLARLTSQHSELRLLSRCADACIRHGELALLKDVMDALMIKLEAHMEEEDRVLVEPLRRVQSMHGTFPTALEADHHHLMGRLRRLMVHLKGNPCGQLIRQMGHDALGELESHMTREEIIVFNAIRMVSGGLLDG